MADYKCTAMHRDLASDANRKDDGGVSGSEGNEAGPGAALCT